MKNKLIFILIGVVIVISLVITQNTRPEKDDLLTIGAVLPLTGPLGSIGQEIKRGMEIALSESSDETIKILFEDDQFSPAKSVAASHKLISIDGADIVTTAVLEQARSMIPVFNDAEVPLLILWDSDESIGKEINPFIYSNGFSLEASGEVMAEFALESLGIETISIIEHITPAAEIMSDAFQQEYTRRGGSIVYHEELSAESSDFRTSIAKLKEQDADAVYMVLIPPGNSKFLTQAQELELDTQILSIDALIQDSIDEAGSAADGVYFTNIYAEDTDEVEDAYRGRYGAQPLDSTLVSFGYEGVQKIIESYEKEDVLVKGLDTVFGKSKSANKVEKIFRVENGKSILIE